MESKEDQVPLQETIYKPISQDTTPTTLKPETSESTSWFVYFAASVGKFRTHFKQLFPRVAYFS